MKEFPLTANESVKKAVTNIISSGRIPHAVLIEGDEGLGKHTLAAYISKSAVCGQEQPFCDACKNCHLADIFSHPDISYLDREEGKKFISVAQIRTMRAEAFVKPHCAKRRVFIIENADMMNEQSQNALLKVLEEPPENVMFILLAVSRTRLLETIVSRCAVLTLCAPEFSLAKEEVLKKTGANPEKVSEAVKTAKNNIGRAIKLLSSKKEDKSQIAAEEFLNLLFSSNEYEMLKLLSPFEKDRISAEEFFFKLKVQIASELKESYNNVFRSKVLSGLYNDIEKYEELLKTNINLPLLFCAAVSKSKSKVRGE